MKYNERFLECKLVLSSNNDEEIERKQNLGIDIEEDDESESESIIDLYDVSVIFQAMPKDSNIPNEKETAIILKSGRTIWVKVPFKTVKEKHGVAMAGRQ